MSLPAEIACLAEQFARLFDELLANNRAQALAISELASRIDQLTGTASDLQQQSASVQQRLSQADSVLTRAALTIAAVGASLQPLSGAAAEITQIALQTRLLALNAELEAKRAGEPGSALGSVAAAVKELAAQVEQSSRRMTTTLTQLENRIGVAANETGLTEDGQIPAGSQRALVIAESSLTDISETAVAHLAGCRSAGETMLRLGQTSEAGAEGLAVARDNLMRILARAASKADAGADESDQ